MRTLLLLLLLSSSYIPSCHSLASVATTNGGTSSSASSSSWWTNLFQPAPSAASSAAAAAAARAAATRVVTSYGSSNDHDYDYYYNQGDERPFEVVRVAMERDSCAREMAKFFVDSFWLGSAQQQVAPPPNRQLAAAGAATADDDANNNNMARRSKYYQDKDAAPAGTNDDTEVWEPLYTWDDRYQSLWEEQYQDFLSFYARHDRRQSHRPATLPRQLLLMQGLTLASQVYAALERETEKVLGMVALHVTLRNMATGELLSPQRAEKELKTALAALPPKEQQALFRARGRSNTRDGDTRVSAAAIVESVTNGQMELVACLCNLAVAPAARRQGIAVALCQTLEDVVVHYQHEQLLTRRAVYLQVEEANTNARLLYQGKLGYKVVGRIRNNDVLKANVDEGRYVASPETTLVLRKDLPPRKPKQQRELERQQRHAEQERRQMRNQQQLQREEQVLRQQQEQLLRQEREQLLRQERNQVARQRQQQQDDAEEERLLRQEREKLRREREQALRRQQQDEEEEERLLLQEREKILRELRQVQEEQKLQQQREALHQQQQKEKEQLLRRQQEELRREQQEEKVPSPDQRRGGQSQERELSGSRQRQPRPVFQQQSDQWIDNFLY